jgi:hypothetical protein
VNTGLKNLARGIRHELSELEQVLTRVQEAWERMRLSGDDFYLDSVALNLHGFYSGIERIFEKLAETVDGSLPTGENWHQVLLIQMSREIEGVRPAVISIPTCQKLNDYRGFRHVVRNVYAYHFDASKLEKLVREAGPVFNQVKAELLAFSQFLDTQS